jgi:PAS domain S-box-containing protein
MRRLLLWIPQVSGLVAVVVGMIVLLSWLSGSEFLVALTGNLATMDPTAAVCMVLAGASLFISQRFEHSRLADRICWGLSVAICAVALASMLQYFAPKLRMTESTAASLLLISAALIASRSRFGLLLTLAAAFFSGLALVGYLYGIRELYSVGPYQSMALHTGACLFFLCLGILFSERHHGLSRVLMQDSAGSNVARRLLPASVVVPVALGIIILVGQRAGLYPQEFGLALFAVSLILAQIFFVVWSASSLTTVDQLRSAAEETTRERQAELRASEERLQLTLDSVTAATFDWDLRTDKVVWSEGVRKLFGLPEDIEPNQYASWMRLIHPEDREKADARIRRAAENGEGRIIFRILRDGEIRWIEAIGKRITNSGEQEHLVGLSIDITVRKRAEDEIRRYRDIFQFASQAICTGGGVDSATLDVMNPAYEKLHGYEAGEMLNLPVRSIYPPELWNRATEAMRIANETGHYAFETRHVRKDGSEFPVYLELTAVRDDTGKLMYRIVNCTDITERRRMEEKLRETAKLESVGVLAGGIAHDFNNILTGILGNASLLDEMLPEDSEFHEIVRTIMKSGERAADLTRQMLAYSGKGRFVVKPIDLSAKIRETAGLIMTSIPRTAELDFHLSATLPAIEADAVQMQQVIMNLIINGAEALNEHPGKVTVTTCERHIDEPMIKTLNAAFEIDPGRYVCLEVTDTGSGMDQATLAKIFDPFFTTKFTGRGLGLSAVLGIVRGHKGSLKVFSEPGRGTTFQIFLPAAQSKVTEAPVREEKSAKGKGTVLVVDDEEVVRRTAQSVLERAGFRVLFANNGRECVETFGTIPDEIDLVLLDMSMPLMSGEEALGHMQKIRPDVRVILSSGFSEAEAIQHFSGKGLAGFLEKPYTSARLAESIGKLGMLEREAVHQSGAGA